MDENNQAEIRKDQQVEVDDDFKEITSALGLKGSQRDEEWESYWASQLTGRSQCGRVWEELG